MAEGKSNALRLGDLLLRAGAITQEQLEGALKAQRESGKRLGAVLLEQGSLSEAQLIAALEQQLGIEYIDLSRGVILGVDFADLKNGVIQSELAKLVPKAVAVKYDVVPVKLEQNTLYLAMSDPLNFMAVEEVKKLSHKKVLPMISTATGIQRTITTLYGSEGAARAIEQMKKDVTPSAQSAAPAGFQIADDDENAAPTVRLVSTMLDRAVSEKASDLHLEPQEEELRVRMRVDGIMRSALSVPKELQQSVISRIKIMGGMDIAERRIPQDGRTTVYVGNKEVDLRISTLPTVFGENIVIRLLDKDSNLFDKKRIGLSGDDITKYQALLRNSAGVVLIAGPTGSGKSSTMYTMMRELNTADVNLITLEDPVEYDMPGISQVQINEKQNMTFAGGLRAVLRQDPDIVAVGEIRDGETATTAMRAAITGHLVLSTIHTNDALSTLDRLLDLGVEPYLVNAALRGVVSQRLMRRICPFCQETYTPSDDDLKFLKMKPEEHSFRRGAGCEHCYGTGYRGRTGVFEILTMSRRLRQAVSQGSSRDEYYRIVREEGFTTLADNCRRLVDEGVTTVEEACRTINAAELDYES